MFWCGRDFDRIPSGQRNFHLGDQTRSTSSSIPMGTETIQFMSPAESLIISREPKGGGGGE